MRSSTESKYIDISVITFKDEDWCKTILQTWKSWQIPGVFHYILKSFSNNHHPKTSALATPDNVWNLQSLPFGKLFRGSPGSLYSPSLADSSVAALFWLTFTWNIFFQPFTFNLCMSLNLRWIFCRHQINGFYFYNLFCQSASFCSWLYTIYNNE